MRALIVSGLMVAAATAQAGDHRADIDYYTRHYDGADIALSRFHCGAHTALRTAEERVDWLGCYARFVEHYKAALPVGRSIPDEVVSEMSDAELAAAQQLMSRVFVQVAQEARQQADLVLLAQQGGAMFSARSASGLLPGLPAQTLPLPDQP